MLGRASSSDHVDLDDYVYDAMRAGASGFLVKDTEPAELIHGVRVVARATRCCPRRFDPQAARRGRRPHPVTSRGPRRPPDLNATGEREVLALVADGLSNDEIARADVPEPVATVKTHVLPA